MFSNPIEKHTGPDASYEQPLQLKACVVVDGGDDETRTMKAEVLLCVAASLSSTHTFEKWKVEILAILYCCTRVHHQELPG